MLTRWSSSAWIIILKSTILTFCHLWDVNTKKETLPKIHPVLTTPSGISERRWFIIMYIFPVKAGVFISISNKKSETNTAAHYQCAPPLLLLYLLMGITGLWTEPDLTAPFLSKKRFFQLPNDTSFSTTSGGHCLSCIFICCKKYIYKLHHLQYIEIFCHIDG